MNTQKVITRESRFSPGKIVKIFHTEKIERAFSLLLITFTMVNVFFYHLDSNLSYNSIRKVRLLCRVLILSDCPQEGLASLHNPPPPQNVPVIEKRS